MNTNRLFASVCALGLFLGALVEMVRSDREEKMASMGYCQRPVIAARDGSKETYELAWVKCAEAK